MSKLLIEESPMCFQRSLAKVIGLNGAIVLQQLQYLLNDKRNGKVFSGERWIYNTYEQWQAEYFPFFSIPTLQRVFAELEKSCMIVSCQPEGVVSRRKYYRLGAGILHLVRAIEDASPSYQNDMIEGAVVNVPLTEKTKNKEDLGNTLWSFPKGSDQTLPSLETLEDRNPDVKPEALASALSQAEQDLAKGKRITSIWAYIVGLARKIEEDAKS